MDISLYTRSFACSVVFSVVPEACADDLLLELSLLIGLVWMAPGEGCNVQRPFGSCLLIMLSLLMTHGKLWLGEENLILPQMSMIHSVEDGKRIGVTQVRILGMKSSSFFFLFPLLSFIPTIHSMVQGLWPLLEEGSFTFSTDAMAELMILRSFFSTPGEHSM